MLSYGQDDGSVAFKKSVPNSFKRCFFNVLKAVSGRKGPTHAELKKRIKN